MILKQPWKRSTTYLNAYINTEKPFHLTFISCGYFLAMNPAGVLPSSLEEGGVTADCVPSSTYFAHRDRPSNFHRRSVLLVPACSRFYWQGAEKEDKCFCVMSFLQPRGYREQRLRILYESLKEDVVAESTENICYLVLMYIWRICIC